METTSTRDPPAPRSLLVTLLAWAVIVLSALLIPVSFISTLMIAVGSYGTNTFDPMGFLIVVVLPPASFVAGIALLRRKRWARVYLMLLMLGVFAWNVRAMIRGPTPQTTTISPTGVKTTTLASESQHSELAMLVSLGILAFLLVPAVRREFP